MTTLERLEHERADYKATAEDCEARALAYLAAGDKDGWEHYARLADLARRMNAYVVGLIDRLGGA